MIVTWELFFLLPWVKSETCLCIGDDDGVNVTLIIRYEIREDGTEHHACPASPSNRFIRQQYMYIFVFPECRINGIDLLYGNE